MNVLTFLAIWLHIAMCEEDKRVITTLKYSKLRVQPTVVNGKPAVEGQVPYLVSLKEKAGQVGANNFVWVNLCGGSIIGDTKVLTAAHCFEGNNFFYAKNYDLLRVVAGSLRTELSHTGNTETTKTSQWRKIIDLKIHDKFHFPANDIALIVVDERWLYNDKVNFIGIATKSIDYPKDCLTAGFGKVGQQLLDSISSTLLLARIDIMTRWQCSVLWEINMNTFVCTSSKVTDVERGDSGGPLSCYGTLDPGEELGKGLLVGIVSGKNYDKTTLYTRISAYRDWIAQNGCSQLNDCFLVLVITELFLLYLVFY